MTAKADEQNRIVVPSAHPGQVYDVEVNAGGIVTLTPRNDERRIPKFVRAEKRDGYTVGVLDGPIDPIALKEALAELP